jgi:hypothetical protein
VAERMADFASSRNFRNRASMSPNTPRVSDSGKIPKANMTDGYSDAMSQCHTSRATPVKKMSV